MIARRGLKPIGLTGWIRFGKDVPEDEVKTNLPRVKCDCGWCGGIWELLEYEGEDTIWCPQCRSSCWEYE